MESFTRPDFMRNNRSAGSPSRKITSPRANRTGWNRLARTWRSPGCRTENRGACSRSSTRSMIICSSRTREMKEEATVPFGSSGALLILRRQDSLGRSAGPTGSGRGDPRYHPALPLGFGALDRAGEDVAVAGDDVRRLVQDFHPLDVV